MTTAPQLLHSKTPGVAPSVDVRKVWMANLSDGPIPGKQLRFQVPTPQAVQRMLEAGNGKK